MNLKNYLCEFFLEGWSCCSGGILQALLTLWLQLLTVIVWLMLQNHLIRWISSLLAEIMPDNFGHALLHWVLMNGFSTCSFLLFLIQFLVPSLLNESCFLLHSSMKTKGFLLFRNLIPRKNDWIISWFPGDGRFCKVFRKLSKVIFVALLLLLLKWQWMLVSVCLHNWTK